MTGDRPANGEESTTDETTDPKDEAVPNVEPIDPATAESDATTPFDLDGDPTEGVHMLILDEVLYAANRDLIDPDDVLALIDGKPEGLELVLTGGHEHPDYLEDRADLLSHVEKQAHPLGAGQPARRGTEY